MGTLTVSPITPKSYGPIAWPFSVVAHRTLLAPCAACATRAAAAGREAGLESHIAAARPLQRASADFFTVLLFKKGRCSKPCPHSYLPLPDTKKKRGQAGGCSALGCDRGIWKTVVFTIVRASSAPQEAVAGVGCSCALFSLDIVATTARAW